ncbi:uncharacterized protein LOC134805952 [Cydia splendana]|uniref:uncharacterized protein LOC134805952 n=1 Tax=Cydia splendana TaxID=1100963 RepID=UPI00300C8902
MSVGKIGAFDVHKDNWDLYVERLGQFFLANDVKPAVQVPTLITVMGSEAYELMANLCSPDKLSTKKYDDLVALMKKHLQPTRSTMAERFKFRQRAQRCDETIAEYTAELKKLTKDCDFQEANLKDNLRDQFVCGIRNDSIRQKLFTEDNLTFERAFKMAVAMEAAESHAALVQDRSITEEGVSSSMMATAVHQLAAVKRDKRQSAEAASTERYGPRGPKVTQCDGTKGAGAGKRRAVRNSAHWKGAQTQQCSACGGQHGQSSCKFKAYVCRVCNKEGHLKKMCPNLRKNVAFHAMLEERAVYEYSDRDSNASDEVNNFSIEAKKFKKYGPYMVQLRVNNVNLVMEVDTGSPISCISYDFYKQLFSEYCEVFEDGLGRFTGGTVGFRLREGAAPVFLRARPLAYALREPVERALDQLVADGVITPVNSSDWATPIVPVMKKDGTIRRKLEQLFGDLPRVGIFLDDLIITGEDDETHLKTLHEVFRRLKTYGLKCDVVAGHRRGRGACLQELRHVRGGELGAAARAAAALAVTFAAAYHPASNGAAEAAVKLCKRAIKKAMRDGGDIDAALQAYLLAYRNVEHSTTGVSPAELLQRRKLRSRLDLLKDGSVEDRVKERQTKQTMERENSALVPAWRDDIVAEAGITWTRVAADRNEWNRREEAYVQKWTAQ